VLAFSVVPDDPAWDFDAFYKGLEARGAVIYPGKLTDAECFRLGSIGVLLLSCLCRICSNAMNHLT
jgi:2-aminoethylphosphonate-pyruvate transaminase